MRSKNESKSVHGVIYDNEDGIQPIGFPPLNDASCTVERRRLGRNCRAGRDCRAGGGGVLKAASCSDPTPMNPLHKRSSSVRRS